MKQQIINSDSGRSIRIYEFLGVGLITVSFFLILIRNYTIRLNFSDVVTWHQFGIHFLDRFATTKLGFGFPLLVMLASKVFGQINVLAINIPILTLLIVAFYYFTSQMMIGVKEDNIISRMTCGFASVFFFITLNYDHWGTLANPLRDPVSWLMLVISCLAIIRYVEHPKHNYAWLITGGLTLIYSACSRETSILVGISFLTYAIASKRANHDLPFWKPTLIFFATCLLVALPYLYQNYLSTGNPFMPGQLTNRRSGSFFAPENFNMSYGLILKALCLHYLYLLPFAVIGIINGIRTRQRILTSLATPAVLVFYAFYASILTNATWRYLIVIDLFFIPIAVTGVVLTVQWAAKFMIKNESKRLSALNFVCISFCIATPLLALMGPTPSLPRFKLSDAKALARDINRYVTGDANLLVEGQGVKNIVLCLTNKQAQEVEPESFYIYTEDIQPIDDKETLLLSRSEAMIQCVENEFTMTQIQNFSAKKYCLDSIMNEKALTLSRITPWQQTSAKTKVSPVQSGLSILEINAGNLSKYKRTYASIQHGDNVLSQHAFDYLNYFTVQVSDAINPIDISITSDSPVRPSPPAKIYGLNTPIILDFYNKNLHTTFNRLSSFERKHDAPYPLMRQSGSVMIPTLARNSCIYIISVELFRCTGSKDEPACRGKHTLLITVAGKCIQQTDLEPDKLKHLAFALPCALVKGENTSLDFKLEANSHDKHIGIRLKNIVVRRKELTNIHHVLIGKTEPYSDIITGLHSENTARTDWLWTDGRFKTAILLANSDSPVRVTVEYYDANRPNSVSPPIPSFSFNGKPYEGQIYTSELDDMSHVTAVFDVPGSEVEELNELEILCRTWSPFDEKISKDKRKLGLMLHSITAERQ